MGARWQRATGLLGYGTERAFAGELRSVGKLPRGIVLDSGINTNLGLSGAVWRGAFNVGEVLGRISELALLATAMRAPPCTIEFGGRRGDAFCESVIHAERRGHILEVHVKR